MIQVPRWEQRIIRPVKCNSLCGGKWGIPVDYSDTYVAGPVMWPLPVSGNPESYNTQS
ncbi:hypothetical protein [Methanospirillum lacunae]|uniref:hypothetical protein n=1 Tax=Methanospirillum lacunae TaxID=668570 RepID=UPI0015E860B0|nr:hypothetical protein [Methanospirillum lacunae]